MKYFSSVFKILAFSLSVLSTANAETPSSKSTTEVKVDAAIKGTVNFESLKDGQTVKSPFKVKMGVSGLKIRPAGENANDATTGHHHLLVNMGPIAKGQVIPADETHLHYGKGQTETELNLKPGDYTLTLQFANGAHLSYGPEYSKTIKIKVVQ